MNGRPLALGTAQLGMPYGRANRSGQPDRPTAFRILDLAREHGFDWLDTAHAYGESEAVIGAWRATPGRAPQPRLVTKIPSAATRDPATLREALLAAGRRLGADCLDGVLLHDENDLDRWEHGLGENLLAAVRDGLCSRVGVSVYSVPRALQACRLPGLGLLQFPASAADRRFRRAGLPALAAAAGITLFARSVYLQGLLLADPSAVPAAIPGARALAAAAARFQERHGLDRLSFCLSHTALTLPGVIPVIGAERPEQVEALARAWSAPLPAWDPDEWDRLWPDDPEDLVNPSRWPPPES